MTASPPAPGLHEGIGLRLADLDQRYTSLRRVLVDTLATAGRPLAIPEILAAAPRLPQSSAYRNLTALIEPASSSASAAPVTTAASNWPKNCPGTTTTWSAPAAPRWKTSSPRPAWSGHSASQSAPPRNSRATRSPNTGSTCSGSAPTAARRNSSPPTGDSRPLPSPLTATELASIGAPRRRDAKAVTRMWKGLRM